MGWLQDLLKQFNQPNKTAPSEQKANNTNMATFIERVSGGDRSTFTKGQVAGTDLLIPYKLENGSVGFLGGDSFSSPFPGGPNNPGQGAGWRSPTGFRSNQDPSTSVLTFDSSYGAPAGGGYGIELCPNAHIGGEFNNFPQDEFTVIPNDAVSHHITGRQVMSFMSINRWRTQNNGAGWTGDWRSSYNGLAYSDNGNNFTRLSGAAGNAVWWNDAGNTSPFQMMTFADSMQGWIYCYSVKAGRQVSPFMLQRVMWDQMFNKAAYQGWNNNGGTWHWGGPDECTSLFPQKLFGEPSVRRLSNGTWAMAYLTSGGKIVSRTSPNGLNWSAEKTQVTIAQEPNLYGGFIHPYSLPGTNKLTLMVSRWSNNIFPPYNTTHYHVSQYRGTL